MRVLLLADVLDSDRPLIGRINQLKDFRSRDKSLRAQTGHSAPLAELYEILTIMKVQQTFSVSTPQLAYKYEGVFLKTT